MVRIGLRGSRSGNRGESGGGNGHSKEFFHRNDPQFNACPTSCRIAFLVCTAIFLDVQPVAVPAGQAFIRGELSFPAYVGGIGAHRRIS